MSQSLVGRWSVAVTALAFVILGGCDAPTGSPSLNTETNINTPLVQEKSFLFLGGPQSEVDPLIDTTSSEFDSLFVVDAESNDISIVQEVDNFNIGTLDGALDDASGDLGFDARSFQQTFVDLGNVPDDPRQIGDVVSEDNLSVSVSDVITVSGSGQVGFEQSSDNEDYVELGNTSVTVQDPVDIKPNANERVFDSLTYVYPDIRLDPYNPDDSLVVEFVSNPCGSGPCGENGEFERDINELESGFDLSLQDTRVYPDKPEIDQDGQIGFEIQGEINPDLQVEDNDEVALGVTTSVGDFEIQELKVSKARPFSVTATPNPDGGDIDVADDAEVETAAFDGFEGVTDRVDGLQLANTSLDFTIETLNLVSTDAQLYAAIQGTKNGGRQSVFLAGTEDQNMQREGFPEDRDVSSLPFDTDFVEQGQSITRDSLIRLPVTEDDLGTSLGQRVDVPLSVDGDNSTVANFINSLPTEVRFAGQARLNTDEGDLKVRKPIELDAGLTLNVPLRIKERFVLEDTIDADFSDLEDLTDPDEDLNISTAELQFSYTNGLPLGADVKMVVVDEQGSEVETFNDNFDDSDFRLKPAQKDDDNAAERPESGEFIFNLGDTQEELRNLADGEEIQLVLNMDQEGSGGGSEAVARLRADDQLTINRIRLNVKASVQTGD